MPRRIFGSVGKVIFASAIALAVTQAAPVLAVAAPARRTATPDAAALRTLLLGTDAVAAIAAAKSLGASSATSAHDALLDGLASGLEADVSKAALAALALHPAPVDVTTLTVYAGHRNPTVRSAAVTALVAYPAPAARALLVKALGDREASVRTAAAGALVTAKSRAGVDRLLILLSRGDDLAVTTLAALADPDLARQISEKIGQVPDGALAACLGKILQRTDFGPDEARVELVRALGKINGAEALAALDDYVTATPAKPPRPSRREAEKIIDARVGGQ